MTKMKLTLVAAMLLLLPCMAFATAVTYSTTGSVSGATFISYTGTSAHYNSTPVLNAKFGILKIRCKATSCPATGATLTITVNQSVPGVGSKSTSATLTGVFSKKAGGPLTLAWTGPVKIKAGGFVTVYTPVTLGTVCTKGNCNVKLQVNITQFPAAAPEPDAQLLLGLGTLGLMGLATVSGKMITG